MLEWAFVSPHFQPPSLFHNCALDRLVTALSDPSSSPDLRWLLPSWGCPGHTPAGGSGSQQSSHSSGWKSSGGGWVWVRFWCLSGRSPPKPNLRGPSHPWVSDKSGVLSLWRGYDPKLGLIGTALTHILGMESQVQGVLVTQVHVVLLPGGETHGKGHWEMNPQTRTMNHNNNVIIIAAIS